ncbi:hypothetical protein GCM10023191_069320 [Actinoallomurus oryzae]|uniref:Integral membrane protein n=1 Tax=Actinoallomurus oryzae TaxID=502180 RepID=A0ABP8QQT1_9ACTN
MNHIEDAQAGLEEIAKRRNQVIDGATRGRHRGWDATGMVVMLAGFATLDLPGPLALQLSLFFVAVVAALACFTRAGRRAKAVMHRSQLTGRFWAVLGGVAAVSGALALGGLWLVERIDVPMGHTLIGVLIIAYVAVAQPVYRALLHRRAA